MRKKLLAMLLCLTMLLSVFPATAFADEPDPVNEDVEAVVEETETATPEDMTAEPTDGEDAETAESAGQQERETERNRQRNGEICIRILYLSRP